jgi:NADH-quinone oxidoreductase subunit E
MILREVLRKYPKKPEYLIEVLLEYQKSTENNYISREDVDSIAKYLDVPQSRVCSVISFYTLLSTEPRGKYVVQVCKDVPCFVNGGPTILKKLEEVLGVKEGETTKDFMFTLEITECLGMCNQSPSMRINDKIYAGLTPAEVEKVINDLRGEAK